MHHLVLFGLAAAAGAQPAESGDPFCAQLRRIVEAAAETPPFASLPAPDERRGAAMLGFPDGCGRSESDAGPLFSCRRQLPLPKLRVDPLAVEVLRCLPAAERLPESGREGMFREHVVRFRAAGVIIELAEGGWRTAGGGEVELAIRPAR